MAELLQKVRRYDKVGFEGNWEMTSQGFLKVPLFATRAGVFEYVMKNGSIRRELCPVEELTDPVSIATLMNAPMCNDHPVKYGDGFVHPENYKLCSVGNLDSTVEIKRGKFLKVDGIIMDAAAIKDVVVNGKREISPGYEADIELTGGIWTDPETGEEFAYDAIQRNRRYNHIAIVNSAREGADIKIRLDSNDAVQYDKNTSQQDEPKNRRKEMKGINLKKFLALQPRFDSAAEILKILNDDKAVSNPKVNVGNSTQGEPEKAKVTLGEDAEDCYDVHKDVADHVSKLHTMLDGFMTAHKALNDAHATLQANMDSVSKAFGEMKGEKEATEAKLNSKDSELAQLKQRLDSATDKAKFNDSVKGRMALINVAHALVGKAKFTELKLDEADDIEVMKAVIKVSNPEAKLDDKSIDSIQGSFDTVKAIAIKEKKLDASGLGAAILEAGSANLTAEQKEKAKRDEIANGWKQPVKGAATKAGAFALTAESQTASN